MIAEGYFVKYRLKLRALIVRCAKFALAKTENYRRARKPERQKEMSAEYPLYPELTEEGKKEADLWLQKFRDKMKKVAEEVVSESYSSCVEYIQSDSWSNFRREILDGFKNYNNRKIQAEYDFAAIRAEIYKQFRDEIIVDLNQDLVKENEELKKRIKYMEEECARRSY